MSYIYQLIDLILSHTWLKVLIMIFCFIWIIIAWGIWAAREEGRNNEEGGVDDIMNNLKKIT